MHYTEHLNQIKTSGYFSLLYINSKAIYTKKISNIFLLPNDVLKRIYIHNKKKKLIPHTFLIKLFQKQIGYPKNFANLNLALSKIMQWYADRGYQWSLVEIKQAADPSYLILNIHEGLVKTITTEYYTLSYKKLRSISSTESIEKYLGVTVGLPLNINVLQKKINYLKDNQLVGNIIYSIERSSNNSMNLDIKFQIQELKDKDLLVLVERSSKTSQIISHVYDLIDLECSSSNWLAASNIMSLSTSKIQACYFDSKIDSEYVYTDAVNLIKRLTYSISHQKTLIIDDFNLQNLLSWTKRNTIGFQLYLRNLDHAKSFCLFSLKCIQSGLNIKISYLNPSLSISRNLSFQIAVQIIKQYQTSKQSALSLFFKKGDLAQFIFESICSYHFTSYFSISEKILLSRVVYIDSIFYNSENIGLYNNNKNHIISSYDIFRHNKKLLYQEFLTLLLSIRYQNFNYLDWPLKGYLFEMKSLYFTPFQKSNFLNHSCLDNYKNLFFHKIYLKQISHFSLPLYFRAHLNHILVNTIKCQSNLNMETIYLLLSDYPIKYTLLKSIVTFSIKVRMEYLIPISRSIRVSLFYNYLDCFLMRQSKHLAYILEDLSGHKQFQSFLLEKFSWGFGIQLKLPIKQMPPLSIEYTVNSGRHFCLYLHIYYQR
uniref:POTRA domain-containing protein n=1 Tax=Pyropia haitanensis TaxID=1262161 RepID=M9PRQ7_PYRHA|nr:hypothetical protein 621 [Neoporphyra haitanensis]AGG37012.1 hypothetical protein 621 [Neoporphyra haitanensis]